MYIYIYVYIHIYKTYSSGSHLHHPGEDPPDHEGGLRLPLPPGQVLALGSKQRDPAPWASSATTTTTNNNNKDDNNGSK